MRKYIGFTVMALALLTIPIGVQVNKTYASANIEYVKIGLESNFKDKDYIIIKNSDIIVSGDNINGLIYSNSGFKVGATKKYYYKSNKTFSNFEDAKAFKDNMNNESNLVLAKLAFTKEGWSIYLGGFNSDSEAKASSDLFSNCTLVKGNDKRVELTGGDLQNTIIIDDTSKFSIKGNSEAYMMIGEKKYRGSLGFEAKNSKVTATNTLLLEEYLYGVIPVEMPASWNTEALKAQSISARSYVYVRTGVHKDLGYDLCDTTHCQVYGGYDKEAEATNNAVDATKNLVAYYDDNPINAVFYSSSGGVTESSQNAWSDKIPYLKSVKELNETTAKIWQRTITMGEVNSLITKNKLNIGEAVGFTIKKTENNRVQELIINGTKGKKSLIKEEIRTFFSGLKGGSLESRLFTLGEESPVITSQDVVNSSTFIYNEGESIPFLVEDASVLYSTGAQPVMGDVSIIGKDSSADYTSNVTVSENGVSTSVGDTVFTGRGWGHGVGMSQNGAKGMADLGYSYEQILKHYYTGIEIK